MGEKETWILVVEDDATSRTMLAGQLHKNGFNVICAEDGKQAGEIMNFCKPDLILLDIIMPRMHGHAFLTELREKDNSVPVIVMSAVESQPQLVATIEHIGIQGWISKPYEPEEVIRKIKLVVGAD